MSTVTLYDAIQDISGLAAGERSGWSVSLNSDGTRVAIGAYANTSNRGITRLYAYSGGIWGLLGNEIPGLVASEYSGYSVSLNSAGNVVAIGGINAGNQEGITRIYQYSGGSWGLLGSSITGSHPEKIGFSVSLNSAGDRVAIGGISYFSPYTGITKVYAYSGGTWGLLGSVIEGADYDRSGYSVSLNSAGDRVAIGAPFNNTDTGITRLYQYNGSTWGLLGNEIPGLAANESSGSSVSLNSAGDRVAIGAYSSTGFKGITRLYAYSGGTWELLGSGISGLAANENSGWSVSLNSTGDRVAIGAPSNTSSTGVTRVYKLDTYNQNQRWIQMLYAYMLAPLCFPIGTPVETDQGTVDIHMIDPRVHTLNGGQNIVVVTRTVNVDPDLVKLEKGSLGNGIPTIDTVISNNHQIMVQGKGTRAHELVGVYPGITKIPCNQGDIFYNVLLENYSSMVVNGMLVETVYPEDPVAQLYKLKDTISDEDYTEKVHRFNST
jgi:hypothetical protein